jgi:hypothetical protein
MRFSVPTPNTGNRHSAGVYFIEQNPPGWTQLFQEVKVDNVAGQDRASVLSGGCEEQRVIQHATSLIFSVSLDPREDAGQYSGFSPDLSVRRNRRAQDGDLAIRMA